MKLLFFPQRDAAYVHFEGSAAVPFEDLATAFSAANAWYLADAALLAYWPPDEVPPAFARAGFGDTQFFTSGSTQCYVASNERAAIVTFRGTQINEIEDGLSDADVTRGAWDGEGRVHNGFLGGLDAVWPQLNDCLLALDGRTVWMTGHSLGAALATLAASRWVKSGGSIGGVYTIGSPRIGDQDFASGIEAALAGKCFRYVNGEDGVTQIPFERWGYRHVGQARVLSGSTDTHPLLQGLEAPLIDHTPRRYATLIWNDLVQTAVQSA
ncbi:MAG TPA: lipase family protein [Vicinamibacterales bacterium]|nr:lipase family protein [Vicinamibacterales bacterium]